MGCPKNQVDSDKIESGFKNNGLLKSSSAKDADLIVVNTCAFIEEAREESIETIFDLVDKKKQGSKIAVTGCMAERYTQQLKKELKEVDLVGGFGTDILSAFATTENSSKTVVSNISRLPKLDLLNLTRVNLKPKQPWTYIKVAEGCDKNCGFCAIPSFRGRQVSRHPNVILDEINHMAPIEAILIAQDIGSYGKDIADAKAQGINLKNLYKSASELVPWVRVFYIYPTSLTTSLIEMMASSPVPYFDLSLQHASQGVLKSMRRYGSMEKFLEKIKFIRSLNPDAVFRTSFLVGYPGETENDHDILLQFVLEAQLDWVGFFTFSREKGTLADTMLNQVSPELAKERLREVKSIQDDITLSKRNDLIGTTATVLLDSPTTGRSYREAPEIDGLIKIVSDVSGEELNGSDKFANKSMDKVLKPGSFVKVKIVGSQGVDLIAVAI